MTMQPRHSSRGGKNKACIILRCIDEQRLPEPDQYTWISRLEYNICIVDLRSDITGLVVEGDGFPLVSPTLQIDCGVIERDQPITDAFCVLGQTLYMFEGSSFEEPCASRKSVFAFDLTRTLTRTLTQRTKKLAKGGRLLKKIGDMTFPKSAPVAFPTPGGERIVVFSTHQFAFELFEPASRSWEQLPPIAEEDPYCMSSGVYGFIEGSNKLLVQTEYNGGMYVLDLASSPVDRRWVKLGTIYSGVDHIPCGCSFFETVGKGRFWFVNTCGLYDLEEYDDREARPRLSGFPHANCCVALLNCGEEGECNFCHVAMDCGSGERGTHSCRALMEVCRVDLKSYKKAADRLSLDELRWADELKLGSTTVVRTLRFSLGFEGVRKVHKPPHLFFTF